MQAKFPFREENMSLEEFRRKYPAQTMTLGNGKPFTYRCYRNPKAAATVVLLTGGIGLSDLFYRHFEWFAMDFSVLTFDYQRLIRKNPLQTTASFPMPWQSCCSGMGKEPGW